MSILQEMMLGSVLGTMTWAVVGWLRRTDMKVIRELLASKKFVASLLGMLGVVAAKLGMPETKVEELLAMASPLIAYVVAQGVADVGKEREKVVNQSLDGGGQ